MRNLFANTANLKIDLLTRSLVPLKGPPPVETIHILGVEDANSSKKLEVLEQSLPGEATDLSEDDAERRGLPDGCILTNWVGLC